MTRVKAKYIIRLSEKIAAHDPLLAQELKMLVAGAMVYEFVYDWLDYKLADWVYGSRGTIEFNVKNQVVRYLQMKRTGSPRSL